MKITCQSCQAKYTIADEKVVGKTVKIKCKKCGSAIVVSGNDAGAESRDGYEVDDGETRVYSGPTGDAAGGAPAGGDDEWTVNVGDDDQRTMTTAQVVAAYSSGTITGDSYVWKDGMADWLPLSQVPELSSVVGAGSAVPAGSALGGTVVMDEGASAAKAPAAARKGGGRVGQDLFGTGKGEPENLTGTGVGGKQAVGERNENSVLFSLSALTASEGAAKTQKDDGKKSKGGLDDIMNLGGGGLGGPMLAPPPLMAPVVEPPLPVMQAQIPGLTGTQLPLTGTQLPLTGTQVPQVVMVQVPEQKKSSAGLVIGIVLGLAVAGGAAFFLLRGPEKTADTNPTASPTASAAPETPTAKPVETTAANTPANTVQPADTSKPEEPKQGATGAVGGTGPKTGGGSDKPTPSATATAAPTAPPTATADSGGSGAGQEFNRGAASAALGAAAGAAKSCKTPDGPTGTGKVKVTFAPSGNVTSAQVQGPPFAGTSVGGCVAGVFRGARVPPFEGAPVSVTKSFSIN